MKKIEAAILSSLGSHRYKVARIIGDVCARLTTTPEVVYGEIATMVKSGKLEGFGNIAEWRHSEIQRATTASAILLPFIIRAKKATYIGTGEKLPSSHPGSHDLAYTEGDLTYRDSYFGGTDFIGQEVVWRHEAPLWSMAYYGYILRPDIITGKQAAKLLRAALSQPQTQGRLLDNLEFSSDNMRYAITSEGTVEHFKGRETITVSGNLAYALDYFGGLIKP